MKRQSKSVQIQISIFFLALVSATAPTASQAQIAPADGKSNVSGRVIYKDSELPVRAVEILLLENENASSKRH